jgi:hypothetical protein
MYLIMARANVIHHCSEVAQLEDGIKAVKAKSDADVAAARATAAEELAEVRKSHACALAAASAAKEAMASELQKDYDAEIKAFHKRVAGAEEAAEQCVQILEPQQCLDEAGQRLITSGGDVAAVQRPISRKVAPQGMLSLPEADRLYLYLP